MAYDPLVEGTINKFVIPPKEFSVIGDGGGGTSPITPMNSSSLGLGDTALRMAQARATLLAAGPGTVTDTAVDEALLKKAA